MLYEEAVRLDPNLAVAKNNLAYLLAEEEKMALLSLEMVKRERERPPAVPHAAADSCDDDDDEEEEEVVAEARESAGVDVPRALGALRPSG